MFDLIRGYRGLHQKLSMTMHLCFNVRERFKGGGVDLRSIYSGQVSSVFQSALTSPLISNKYI